MPKAVIGQLFGYAKEEIDAVPDLDSMPNAELTDRVHRLIENLHSAGCNGIRLELLNIFCELRGRLDAATVTEKAAIIDTMYYIADEEAGHMVTMQICNAITEQLLSEHKYSDAEACSIEVAQLTVDFHSNLLSKDSDLGLDDLRHTISTWIAESDESKTWSGLDRTAVIARLDILSNTFFNNILEDKILRQQAKACIEAYQATDKTLSDNCKEWLEAWGI